MRKILLILALIMTYNTQAQQPLTPEKLWEVQRVGGIGLTPDKKQVLLSVTTPNVAENSFKKEYYKLDVNSWTTLPLSTTQTRVSSSSISQ